MLETLKEALSPASEEANETPTDEPLGTLEPVAYFYDAIPTGVTVSQRGRIFVNYPNRTRCRSRRTGSFTSRQTSCIARRVTTAGKICGANRMRFFACGSRLSPSC
jgi:hypothetical protein